jgi:N-hydroxyarylamine O-acetyltransferase
MNSNDHTLSIEKYLERINYRGDLSLSYNTLSQLVNCHFTSVPYENLDILNNIPLSLEIPDLYDKIVNRHRGGYCFELNTLFNWLLNRIGFKTCSCSARFLLNVPENTFPMRRHRVMKTEINGATYIADVGVGNEVPVHPLQLDENHIGHETATRGLVFRFIKDEIFGWVLQFKNQKKTPMEWKGIYGFTEEIEYEIDYVQPNFWCQYSPDSPFRIQNWLALRTENGKYTIDGNIFRIYEITEPQLKITEKIFEPHELNGILKDYFGIVL